MKNEQPKLLESQKQLLQAGFLESERNWIICAPTGAGKTLMAEWAIQQAVSRGRRGIFIAPLKAIVEEKTKDWENLHPHFITGLYTGDTTRSGSHRIPRGENLLLMTPEKLYSYLNGWKRNLAWLSEIDVVVLDEFHLLGDPSRGAVIESLIGRLQRINPFVRFIGLSATIPNAEQLADWLNAETFITTWRPVPLIHRVVRFKKATDKPQLLASEVLLTVKDNGQVLVFVNSRRRSEQLAEKLRLEGFRADFYHAGLDKKKRSLRHDAMQEHGIDALVSTSSLEMGVNFPARKVVVYDSYTFNGESFGPLPVSRYLQCAGRAGRPGFDNTGESVIFLPKWHKEADVYLSGTPDPVTSGLFRLRSLQKEIITEVSTRLSISQEHLATNFSERTFRRKIEGKLNLSSQIEKLLSAGLMKRSGESERYLVATPLGRIATQMDASPETILVFDRFYRQIPSPCLFDCLLTVCLCPELTPKLPFYFEQIDNMADALSYTPSHLLDAPVSTITRLWPRSLPAKTLLAAIKSAVVLLAHTAGEPIESLAERFDCYPIDLMILKKNCEWMLATAHRIFAYRWSEQWKRDFPEENDTVRPLCTHEKRIKYLMPMIKYGLPAKACALVKVKGIGPKRALSLLRANISSLNALCAAAPEFISATIGLRPENCINIQESANQIIIEESFVVPFDLPQEPMPVGPYETITNWPNNVDPYRLRRALDLKVIHRSDECLRVEGGTEPHTIQIRITETHQRTYQCDCMDAAKGKLCKHVMRARLEMGDGQELMAALHAFQTAKIQPLRYALTDLWIQGAEIYDRYEERNGDYDGQRFLIRNIAAHRWDR